jgi:Protein of unknown function (DUF3761)
MRSHVALLLVAVLLLLALVPSVHAQTVAGDPAAQASPFGGPQLLATAQCNDGWFSFSQATDGTCAGHGGVMTWITQPGTGSAVVQSRADQQAQEDPDPRCLGTVPGPPPYDEEFAGECGTFAPSSTATGGGSGAGGGGGLTGCGSRGGPGYRLPSGKCA